MDLQRQSTSPRGENDGLDRSLGNRLLKGYPNIVVTDWQLFLQGIAFSISDFRFLFRIDLCQHRGNPTRLLNLNQASRADEKR